MTNPHIEQLEASQPKHVAFIMDGNRRWAKERDLSASDGHKAGSKTAEKIVEWCVKASIPHITLWALSTENWKKRSKVELSTIFALLSSLPKQMGYLRKHGVSIDIIGNKEAMPAAMRSIVETVESSLYLPDAPYKVHIALNYGGRDELLNAFHGLAKVGNLTPTAEEVSTYLYTKSIPDVDLIIRSGGEKRLSGFMLWQSEYAELAFLEEFWPEMSEEILLGLLSDFAQKKRNFGA